MQHYFQDKRKNNESQKGIVKAIIYHQVSNMSSGPHYPQCLGDVCVISGKRTTLQLLISDKFHRALTKENGPMFVCS